MKQEAMALALGLSQQAVSALEQKEQLDERLLTEVATLLKVPVEAIQRFDEEKAVNIISNTFNDQSNGYNYYPTFQVNPIEKWLEAMEENRKLYERLLKAEQEKTALLEKLLKDRG